MSDLKPDFAKQKIETPSGSAYAFNVLKLKELGYDVERLPYSIRVLLENSLRHTPGVDGAADSALSLAAWPGGKTEEMPFMPFRVLLQDYTGVPLIVDLAAMRDAARKAGLDVRAVNSTVPVDLVIDHSVQVDSWSNEMAFDTNLEREYERNAERYSLLKWAQSSFRGLTVFPPGKGICHQVNLEYISRVVSISEADGAREAFPDTLVGTDSHTTMVNGLGVLGWGVGGIEAEAVMLGEPYHMPIPRVLGVRFTGALREGVTPTDLVLAVTEKLRERNVVGQFVEFFGEGYRELSVPDRATIGNMSPEYGATVGFSPVDKATLSYLRATGRQEAYVDFVRRYCTDFGFFVNGDMEPRYSDVLQIDLDKIESAIAGPRNPEERRTLRSVPSFVNTLLGAHRSSSTATTSSASSGAQVTLQDRTRPTIAPQSLQDGAVIIAAITSCTNTSNPTVMVGAGLLAKRAVEAGLTAKPWVKRSLAPGSTVVTDYLRNAGVQKYLDVLGFNLVGYGCTTCIGNSGPLAPEIEKEITQRDLYAVAVLSGNRNFDGRIHPLARGAFLMSPMLVVAYSIAGRIDFDFENTPLGSGKDGSPVFLRDIWPSLGEIKKSIERSLSPELYVKRYSEILVGDARWKSLSSYADDVYHWDERSTYIRRPSWFDQEFMVPADNDIHGARVLAVLEDKVTTDHISPAGSITVDGPAGRYLTSHGVDMIHFSSYGSRRGNHEVMVRGGFSNIRLKNLLGGGRAGGWTTHIPTGKVMPIYDAAMEYAKDQTPLIVIAGKQYGAGSSRDWAAKAPRLLGVRAVIAENFERIHRSNLIAMGVLPLEFARGENMTTLGLTGNEEYDVLGVSSMSGPRATLDVVARDRGTKNEKRFKVLARIDNGTELQYIRRGGVLPFVFSRLTSRP